MIPRLLSRFQPSAMRSEQRVSGSKSRGLEIAVLSPDITGATINTAPLERSRPRGGRCACLLVEAFS